MRALWTLLHGAPNSFALGSFSRFGFVSWNARALVPHDAVSLHRKRNCLNTLVANNHEGLFQEVHGSHSKVAQFMHPRPSDTWRYFPCDDVTVGGLLIHLSDDFLVLCIVGNI